MTDSIGFKIIKGILVVVIPLLFIITFAFLFLKLAGFNVKDEMNQLTSHIPFVTHTAKTVKTTGTTADQNQTIAGLQEELKQVNKEIKSKDQQIQDLNAKISEIEQTNTDQKVAAQDTAAKAKAQTIAQVYQTMDPAKAAAILSKMKDSEAANYLNMMNNQTKAKILEQMSADVAAKITPLLIGQPSPNAG